MTGSDEGKVVVDEGSGTSMEEEKDGGGEGREEGAPEGPGRRQQDGAGAGAEGASDGADADAEVGSPTAAAAAAPASPTSSKKKKKRRDKKSKREKNKEEEDETTPAAEKAAEKEGEDQKTPRGGNNRNAGESPKTTKSKKKKKKKKKKKNSAEKKDKEGEDIGGSPKKKKKNKKKEKEISERGPESDEKGDGSVGGEKKKKKRKKREDPRGVSRDYDEQEEGSKAPPPPPTIDVAVHRLRHLQYQPKPVLCIEAAPPPPALLEGDGLDLDNGDYAIDGDRCCRPSVAVSRADGSVELRSASCGGLRTVASVAGYPDRPATAMAWICRSQRGQRNVEGGGAEGTMMVTDDDDEEMSSPNRDSAARNFSRSSGLQGDPALVGASRDGSLFLVDFASSRIRGWTPSGGGGVFCLASCRRCPGLVAAGCEDGSVRFFLLGGDDEGDDPSQRRSRAALTLASVVPSAGAAILSLAWRHRVDGGGSTLFAGVADGTIRRWDSDAPASSSGAGAGASAAAAFAWKSTLRMTVENYGRSTPTKVWAVEALEDGTVVSADSLGHVQFWDGEYGTLLQTFDQNDSKADALTLAVSENECKVFASGVDSRVVCIERQQLQQNVNKDEVDNPWILSQAQRPHTHDVNAMAILRQPKPADPSETNDGDEKRRTHHEVLYTGGVDTKICTYVVENFAKRRPRIVYPWRSDLISVARGARLVVMLRDTSVDIYRLGSFSEGEKSLEDLPLVLAHERTHIGTIAVKSASNLACAAISDDGRHLALANAFSVQLFGLGGESASSGEATLQPTQIEIDTASSSVGVFSASAMCFTPSGDELLVSALDGRVRVISITTAHFDTDSASPVAAEVRQNVRVLDDPPGKASAAAQNISVSPDGKYFVVQRNLAVTGKVQVFRRHDGGEYRHWWTLPSLEAPPSAVGFVNARSDSGPSSSSASIQLVVGCVNFVMYVFDIEERKLHRWSEAVEYPISQSLPAELQDRNDHPVRLASNPASPNQLLLGSFGAFIAFNLNEKFPTKCRVFPQSHVRGWKKKKKRKLSDSLAESLEGPSAATGEEIEPANEEDTTSCTMCLRYNSMLCVDFVDKNEMLIVEQPWLNVVANFPDALHRRVYGS